MSSETQRSPATLVPSQRALELALAEDAVTRASAIAAGAGEFNITTADDAAQVADFIGALTAGTKILTAKRDEALKPLKASEQSIRGWFAPYLDDFTQAIAAYKLKNTQWREREQARLDEERRQQEADAKAAAEKAALEAQVFGGPPPPPTLFTQEPVSNIVRGGAYSLSSRDLLKCELHNPANCDPTWLDLKSAPAKAAYREAVKQANALPCDGVEGVVWCGVRFWYEKSEASRRNW
jgi:hypothetical protein